MTTTNRGEDMTDESQQPEPENLSQNPGAEGTLHRLISDHLLVPMRDLAVVEQAFDSYQLPNLHLAMEELLAAPERVVQMVGVVATDSYDRVTLAKLSSELTAGGFAAGPVVYTDVTLADDRRLTCVKEGVFLIREGDKPLVVLQTRHPHNPTAGPVLEVTAPDRELAERFLALVTRATLHGKAFRGSVLSLESDCYGNVNIHYHKLPRITREEIVLPEALLDLIERHTIRFTRHAERLRAAGRHIKRGLLLHGPPGTGKTLTSMYLASQMEGRTVLLLTGSGIGSMERVAQLARLLEPATIILEDVDLIGTSRENQNVGANALLFELLNQMDGLAEDADILYVLTTNRPDILEPALAARPGRIDQAIEVPLPDGSCRRRLLDLYGKGLDLQVEDMDRLVVRTKGVSGAFIRELLRKAALLAADESDEGALVVNDARVDQALQELVVLGGELTQTLLGSRVEKAGTE